MEVQAENEQLKKENRELRQMLKEALARIKELEAQMGQNSQNSNWLSIWDEGHKKKRTQNLR